jgi:hypothetical protein
MADHTESMTNPDQEAKFSVVTVPEHLREQVLEHVRTLMQDDEDVSGYMLRLGASISPSTKVNWCGTGCSTWDTKGLLDMGCGDSD